LSAVGGESSGAVLYSEDGLIVTTGLSTYNGGIQVIADGMTVNTGASTVSSLFKVGGTSANLIVNGGIKVTGGFTVSDTGLTITDNGLSVLSGNAYINGGLSVTGGDVTSGGKVTADKLTIANRVTVSNGGLTVIAGGIKVTGGVTMNDPSSVIVQAGGLTVETGFTVSATSDVNLDTMLATNGLTVSGGGIRITSGDMTVSGTAVAFATVMSSDRNLKTNITAIDNPLNKILDLRGVNYKWKKDTKKTEKWDTKRLRYGVIAQEVKEVFPDIVSVGGDDFHTVQYEGLIPLMIEALKELNDICVSCDKELMALIKELRGTFEKKFDEADRRYDEIDRSTHEQDVAYESLLDQVNTLRENVLDLKRSMEL